MGVNVCCWDGNVYQTYTLKSYFDLTSRHQRMADYLAGACSKVNVQAVVGHALANIESGVNNVGTGSNWLQLITSTAQAFIDSYWTPNNVTGLTPDAINDVQGFDFLNAAAGMWYFMASLTGLSGDPYSYKSIQWRATQYNFGPTRVPSGCQPSGTSITASAYAWTLAFLAWGQDYASVTDARYSGTGTMNYARYATSPTGTQNKYLNPTCSSSGQLTVPSFTPTYALQSSPYGRNSASKQMVILARTDIDYVSALAAAMNLKRNYPNSVAPVVTADTYFACSSMRASGVFGIVLGSAAKSDVNLVDPGLVSFATFTDWYNSPANGYCDASAGSTSGDYATARDQAVAAYNGAGY